MFGKKEVKNYKFKGNPKKISFNSSLNLRYREDLLQSENTLDIIKTFYNKEIVVDLGCGTQVITNIISDNPEDILNKNLKLLSIIKPKTYSGVDLFFNNKYFSKNNIINYKKKLESGQILDCKMIHNDALSFLKKEKDNSLLTLSTGFLLIEILHSQEYLEDLAFEMYRTSKPNIPQLHQIRNNEYIKDIFSKVGFKIKIIDPVKQYYLLTK